MPLRHELPQPWLSNSSFKHRRRVQLRRHPNGALVDDQRPSRMIGNESVILEPEGLGLAFPHQFEVGLRAQPVGRPLVVSARSSSATCATRQPHADFFAGTFLPFARASERPIAIACFLLFTVLPLLPLLSVPALRRFMAPFTSLDADLDFEPLSFLLSGIENDDLSRISVKPNHFTQATPGLSFRWRSPWQFLSY